MPIYEYQCEKCKKINEVFQKFSDLPITECKYCGNLVKKIMSINVFHLKGTGWYATNYEKKDEAKTNTNN